MLPTCSAAPPGTVPPSPSPPRTSRTSPPTRSGAQAERPDHRALPAPFTPRQAPAPARGPTPGARISSVDERRVGVHGRGRLPLHAAPAPVPTTGPAPPTPLPPCTKSDSEPAADPPRAADPPTGTPRPQHSAAASPAGAPARCATPAPRSPPRPPPTLRCPRAPAAAEPRPDGGRARHLDRPARPRPSGRAAARSTAPRSSRHYSELFQKSPQGYHRSLDHLVSLHLRVVRTCYPDS